MTDSQLFVQGISNIGSIGLAVGVGFFLIFAAAAYIAFRVMRRTMKIAIRMAVVGILLLVAVVGGIAIFWMSWDRGATTTRPSNSRQR